MVNSIRAIAVVRYIVGGRSWEGPLWEVPLYMILCLCACCVSGNVCGFAVGFWWSVKFLLSLGVREEQDGGVLSVS